jgi:hypothetical protein
MATMLAADAAIVKNAAQGTDGIRRLQQRAEGIVVPQPQHAGTQAEERSHGWGHGWGRLGALHRWGSYS